MKYLIIFVVVMMLCGCSMMEDIAIHLHPDLITCQGCGELMKFGDGITKSINFTTIDGRYCRRTECKEKTEQHNLKWLWDNQEELINEWGLREEQFKSEQYDKFREAQ